MIESLMVFEENIASATTPQRARGLADWLRTCVGLVVPTGSAECGSGTSRQDLHDEHRPSALWHEARAPEDDVRQHFRGAVKDIMGQGPVGTDFVLCAVGRMAEDILRIAENAERDSQIASKWIEYARWLLPGFNGTVAASDDHER
jgi:hypothetical protein